MHKQNLALCAPSRVTFILTNQIVMFQNSKLGSNLFLTNKAQTLVFAK